MNVQPYEKPRIHFPQYGEFGYDEPVGKKNYQKSTAIKELIFYENKPQASSYQPRYYGSSPR